MKTWARIVLRILAGIFMLTGILSLYSGFYRPMGSRYDDPRMEHKVQRKFVINGSASLTAAAVIFFLSTYKKPI